MFTSDRGGGPQIYEVNLRSGAQRRLTFNQSNYNARPRYAPDGKRIAMVTSNGQGYQIGVLTLSPQSFEVVTTARLDESPTFAPNSAMLMYTTTGPAGTELAAVSVDGRTRQRLALQRGEVREPAWGPFRE